MGMNKYAGTNMHTFISMATHGCVLLHTQTHIETERQRETETKTER